MQNVEFKAELREPELAEHICRRLGAVYVASLEQTDTYFRVPDGRLKKTLGTSEAGPEPVEWVFYRRENRSQPKISRFTVYSEQDAKTRYGERPLPVWLIVKKKRQVWLQETVRIHLDHIVGLGDFIEFEALVSPKQTVLLCHEMIRRLRGDFSMILGEPIACGYSDLMSAEAEAV